MMQKAYIETSVVSYLCGRASRNLIVAANQRVTRDWWKSCRPKYDAYVSQLVLDEIAVGDAVVAEKRKNAVRDMAVLPIDEQVERLAAEILRRAKLPQRVTDDILHIAVASVSGLEYLVTWNCAHIANPHWQAKIRSIVRDLGYAMPEICTPQQMCEGEQP